MIVEFSTSVLFGPFLLQSTAFSISLFHISLFDIIVFYFRLQRVSYVTDLAIKVINFQREPHSFMQSISRKKGNISNGTMEKNLWKWRGKKNGLDFLQLKCNQRSYEIIFH